MARSSVGGTGQPRCQVNGRSRAVSGPETRAEKAGTVRCSAGACLACLFPATLRPATGLRPAGLCPAGWCLADLCLPALGSELRCAGLAAACRVGLGAETGGAGFAQPVARKMAAPITAIVAVRGLVTSLSVRAVGQASRRSKPVPGIPAISSNETIDSLWR